MAVEHSIPPLTIGDRTRRHGLSHSRTHNVWMNLRARCKNPKSHAYKDYGGRGITYDPRWESFDDFLADMGECPPGHQIDRKDNDGPYCKANCRWVMPRINSNNRRSNRILEWKGKQITLADLAREVGVPLGRVHSRLQAGYSVEEAVSAPVHRVRSAALHPFRGEMLSVQQIAKLAGKNWSTISQRLKAGMSAEEAATMPSRRQKGKGYRSRHPGFTE